MRATGGEEHGTTGTVTYDMAKDHMLLVSWLGHSNGSSNGSLCPQRETCSQSDLRYLNIGPVPSYLAIVSSALSCVGSLLIVGIFLAFRDLRSGAQKIITFLAIADFVSAAGYIVGSANFITHFNQTEHEKCKVFKDICKAQATITSWSSLASFAWTIILAFYFYMVIVYNKRTVAAKLMPLYHVLAWILPLFIIVPLTALDKLGYAPYAASNWCYVKSSNSGKNLNLETTVFIFLAGKFWEISTYILSILIYAHIVLKLCRHKQYQPLQAVQGVERPEKRLIYIPALFLLLRIWGTVQLFYSMAVSKHIHNGCIPGNVLTGFKVLGYLQAIGDPGQGWGNAVLYVFLSPTIRRRLFCVSCQRYIRLFGGWLITLADSTYGENQQPQNNRDYGSHEERAPLHSAPHPPTCSVTVSSCDITEVECGPTPGAEPEPSPIHMHLQDSSHSQSEDSVGT